MMRSKKRPILPESNDNYVQIPGRRGSILYPQGPHDRYIELVCAYVGEDLPDIRVKAREIAAWLYTEDREILSFDDEPGIYYRGKLTGEVGLEHIGKMAQFTLVFRCEPFVYGGEENQIFVGDSAVVDNQGTLETFPRFMVTFINAVGEWKVANQDGDYIKIVHDFEIGDTLEVNCQTGAILINDARAMDKLDWQNSRFFALREGENSLVIAPTGRCNTTVYWTPNYL
jgi:predicted phage tail component-like protein